MKASTEAVEWLRSFYGALDSLRFDEAAEFIHEDCESHYPGGAVVRGRERVLRVTSKSLTALASIRHELRNAWEEEDGQLIFELEVTYVRREGQTIVRRGVGIFVREGGMIRQMRLFVDSSGVWD